MCVCLDIPHRIFSTFFHALVFQPSLRTYSARPMALSFPIHFSARLDEEKETKSQVAQRHDKKSLVALLDIPLDHYLV